jgi:hypothetical protein
MQSNLSEIDSDSIKQSNRDYAGSYPLDPLKSSDYLSIQAALSRIRETEVADAANALYSL